MTRTPIEMPRGKRSLIAPSLLSADFLHLADEIKALEQADADWLHFDVMDGRFVPNISVGIPILKAVRRASTLPIDVHLMIVEPERYVEMFVDAGADILTVHAEASVHLHRTVQHIKSLGVRAGVSLNPHTSLDVLDVVLPDLDLVLLMTVNPGFGGQGYIDGVTEKIRRLRARADARGIALDIEVDGGVKTDNLAVPAAAGANVFVSGSGVLGTEDYGQTISAMRSVLGGL